MPEGMILSAALEGRFFSPICNNAKSFAKLQSLLKQIGPFHVSIRQAVWSESCSEHSASMMGFSAAANSYRLFRRSALAHAFALIAIAGCTVNPKPDYERANSMIQRATGQTAHYDPDADATIRARVDQLLVDGLTVDHAVQICLLNNKNLQAAWMQIGMAKSDLVQSGLLSNPTLDISLRFPAAGGLPDVDANLAQNIADLWQIAPRKKAAEHALAQTILDLARQANELASAAKTAYFQAVGAKQSVEIAQQNLDTAKQSLDLTTIRQKSGAAAEVDVNLSKAPVLDAELALSAATLDAIETRNELAKTLGLDDDPATLVLRDPLPEPPIDQLEDTALIDLAHQERLDIRSNAEVVDAAAARMKQQWRAIFPNVQLGVATERSAQKAQQGRKVLADTVRKSIAAGQLTAPEIQPSSERGHVRTVERNLGIITGPSLNITIPAFDQNQAQIAKAVFAYRQAVKAYEAADLALTQDVRTIAARARTAWSVARFYREQSIPLAQRNLDLSLQTYRAGQATLLQVLELQRFVLETRSKYVQAQREAAARMADLERTIGLPLNKILAGVTSTAPPSNF